MDFALVPGVVLKKIISFLSLKDRLSFAATCRPFNDAIYTSDVGCELFVLSTSEVERVKVTELASTWSPIQIDPFTSFWLWTTDDAAKTLASATCRAVAKMSTHVGLAVDDKVKDVTNESIVWRWLDHLDGPGLSSLILRPCNMAKAIFPDMFRKFLKKLSELIVINEATLRELHFVTWPLEVACRQAEIPTIHEILENLPLLKSKLKAFSYLWQGNDLRSWQPANLHLPNDDINVPLIASMTNLQQLNVASQILTGQLLKALSSRPGNQLKYLRVCYSDVVNEISDLSWSEFSSRSTSCRVEFSLMRDKIRVNSPLWRRLFLPSIPLVSISFMKHAHCEDDELRALTDLYGNTIDSVTIKSLNHNVSSGCLLEFIEKTRALVNFVYFGVVDLLTVERVISAGASRWKEVVFVAEQVNLADPRADDQDEFFFERRKLLMEAENQQQEVLSNLVEKYREVICGSVRFISLKDADWNVEHLATVKIKKL